jgi:hypothetical protein
MNANPLQGHWISKAVPVSQLLLLEFFQNQCRVYHISSWAVFLLFLFINFLSLFVKGNRKQNQAGLHVGEGSENKPFQNS